MSGMTLFVRVHLISKLTSPLTWMIMDDPNFGLSPITSLSFFPLLSAVIHIYTEYRFEDLYSDQTPSQSFPVIVSLHLAASTQARPAGG